MKTAVVLRHAQRQDRSDNQSHLAQAGITQARAAGEWFERFDFVVASPLPRAYETAIAMGFAVDMTDSGIQEHSEQLMRDVEWDEGYAAWATAYATRASVIAYVDHVGSLLREWLEMVPAGGSLLVVTHGGIVEAMAVGLAPGDDLVALGAVAGYAEGFRAVTEKGEGFELSALRQPDSLD
jgi:broad specificity phosphatase PhoE